MHLRAVNLVTTHHVEANILSCKSLRQAESVRPILAAGEQCRVDFRWRFGQIVAAEEADIRDRRVRGNRWRRGAHPQHSLTQLRSLSRPSKLALLSHPHCTNGSRASRSAHPDRFRGRSITSRSFDAISILNSKALGSPARTGIINCNSNPYLLRPTHQRILPR